MSLARGPGSAKQAEGFTSKGGEFRQTGGGQRLGERGEGTWREEEGHGRAGSTSGILLAQKIGIPDRGYFMREVLFVFFIFLETGWGFLGRQNRNSKVDALFLEEYFTWRRYFILVITADQMVDTLGHKKRCRSIDDHHSNIRHFRGAKDSPV